MHAPLSLSTGLAKRLQLTCKAYIDCSPARSSHMPAQVCERPVWLYSHCRFTSVSPQAGRSSFSNSVRQVTSILVHFLSEDAPSAYSRICIIARESSKLNDSVYKLFSESTGTFLAPKSHFKTDQLMEAAAKCTENSEKDVWRNV